ncbi:MAG: hypothetical protein JXA54_15830 [Candidatus Heimdallarchaeota archaeon]|nr:hypothetical protein [Candidatus Heimdallarchaeota archaeon]
MLIWKQILQRISQCGASTNCVDACPPKAITGKLWTYGMIREEIFNVYKCHDHLKIQKERVGETICGICIAVRSYG